MERKKRRQYTPMEQAAVVRDVEELGVVGAAKKHDVPQSCVSRWACAARDALASAGEPELTQAPEAVPALQPLASGTTATGAGSDNVQAKDSLGTKPVLSEPPAAAKGKPGSRVAKLYAPSQKAQVLEHAAAHGVTAAAEKFDISRFSIYDWQRKLAKAAKGEGPSPTSGPAPADIAPSRRCWGRCCARSMTTTPLGAISCTRTISWSCVSRTARWARVRATRRCVATSSPRVCSSDVVSPI